MHFVKFTGSRIHRQDHLEFDSHDAYVDGTTSSPLMSAGARTRYGEVLAQKPLEIFSIFVATSIASEHTVFGARDVEVMTLLDVGCRSMQCICSSSVRGCLE